MFFDKIEKHRRDKYKVNIIYKVLRTSFLVAFASSQLIVQYKPVTDKMNKSKIFLILLLLACASTLTWSADSGEDSSE